MPVSDFQTGSTLLQNALKNLQRRWELTHETWSDATAEKFAAEHLEPLAPKMRLFLDTASRLAVILQRAETECQ